MKLWKFPGQEEGGGSGEEAEDVDKGQIIEALCLKTKRKPMKGFSKWMIQLDFCFLKDHLVSMGTQDDVGPTENMRRLMGGWG